MRKPRAREAAAVETRKKPVFILVPRCNLPKAKESAATSAKVDIKPGF
jgi:hypothetical protein